MIYSLHLHKKKKLAQANSCFIMIWNYNVNVVVLNNAAYLNWSRAGSLNQGVATTYSEPILKAAHQIAIFKRKMAVVSRKHLGNTHQLGGSSLLQLPVSL